jgi:hypothetical protein
MAANPDRYDARYTEKLWNLLPELYRAMDSDSPDETGPLREIVARIGAQAAVVRRSLDRLWENQSIESCDDLFINYIGDLLATNIVASLDARNRRLDVAKTIYYRRRKGTVALAEELAKDITGWKARVSEFFLGLARTRHNLDPAISQVDPVTGALTPLQLARRTLGVRTRTAAGGFADLRNVHGANLAGSAFDEYFHTADVRRGRGATGWYNIPRLGVFVWRLKTFSVQQVTPLRVKGCPQEYTFDPTGRDSLLFAREDTPTSDQWISPLEHQVPGPISFDLLRAEFTELYREKAPRSLGVFKHNSGPHPYDLVLPKDVRHDPREAGPPNSFWIDPVRGRIIAAAAGAVDDYRVDYHYGFSSEIGAGPYDRRIGRRAEGSSAQPIEVSENGATLPAALQQISAAGSGALTIADSLTYTSTAPVNVSGAVLVQSENLCRPLVRPVPAADWTFNGVGPAATLVLDGVFVSGGTAVVLTGTFESVTLRCCTLDPGTWNSDPPHPAWKTAADGQPLAASTLRIEGAVRTLSIQRSILGPIADAGPGTGVESAIIADSIVQSAEQNVDAIALPRTDVSLTRCSILGTAKARRLEVSECILHDVAGADDTQQGCVRFSAFASGSKLPRRYECIELRVRAGLFERLDFGNPKFAQLLPTVPEQVMAGAEDGSEMGAFAREKAAIRERSLLIKYQEYLPLGIEPLVIHVT